MAIWQCWPLVTQLQFPILSVLLTATGQICSKDCIHVSMLFGVTLQCAQWLKCVDKICFYCHVDSPNRGQPWSKSCRQQTSPKGFVGFKINRAVTKKNKLMCLLITFSREPPQKSSSQHLHTQLLYIFKHSIAKSLLVQRGSLKTAGKKRILTNML